MPIHIAALRPGMLELAGELGDGVVLNLTPAELLPRVLEHVDTGAKRSGRRVEDLEIVSLLNTFVTDDVAAGTQAMRRVALGYYSTGVYASFLAWLGRPREAEQIQAGVRRARPGEDERRPLRRLRPPARPRRLRVRGPLPARRVREGRPRHRGHLGRLPG